MLNAAHFAVGLAIGRNIPSPGTAFLAGLASHFLLDWIPHWDGVEGGEDGEVNWKERKNLTAVGRDLLLTGLIGWFALSQGWLGWGAAYTSVIWGVLGAVFPDILWIPYHVLGLRHPRHFFEFHRHIQHSAGFLPGITMQIALIFLSLLFSR